MERLKNKIVVVAVGGNALVRENQKGTLDEQVSNVI
jgi:carbamate kinase